jgi:hypothetical protein
MPPAPTVRAIITAQTGVMPTHQSGDIIIALGSGGTPTYSADWTTVVSGTNANAAYKLATSSSTPLGTLSNATFAVLSITGASTTNTSGASPSFLGGGTIIANGGANFTIPTFPPLTTPAIQLSWCYGVAGGGNPWLSGATQSNVTVLANNGYQFILVSSDGTTAGTVGFSPSYGGPNYPMVTVKILAPNPPGFFAMF